MSLKASAKPVGDSLCHEIRIGNRHLIFTDEPESLGGTDAGPTPHELLPAALAACVSTMISIYARTKGWDLGEVAVDVEYDNKAVPRRFQIEVRLPHELSPSQVDRLRRVADTCPLRKALQTGFEFQERIVSAPVKPHGQGV
jgi:putative redox protein